MTSSASTAAAAPVVLPRIEHRTQVTRGQKVLIDADLATLYSGPTRRLKEQVMRNAERSPGDFMYWQGIAAVEAAMPMVRNFDVGYDRPCLRQADGTTCFKV